MSLRTIVADLSHFGLIRFAGDDAQHFLNSQLSCDVNSLEPRHARYGSYSTPQGRMLASFLLWRDAAGFFMQLPASVREATQQYINMQRATVAAERIFESIETQYSAAATEHSTMAQAYRGVPSRLGVNPAAHCDRLAKVSREAANEARAAAAEHKKAADAAK